MVSTTIVQMSPSDPRWISFLESSADARIFHQPAWSQLMSECYGYRPFILALSGTNGTLTTGAPFMEVSSPLTGKRWVSLPFSDYCFPLNIDSSALDDFAEGIACLAKSTKIHSLELRGTYPELAGLHAYSQHVIHEMDLRPGIERIWEGMHEMHRRNIKIAKENGVHIVQGTAFQHLENFYELHLLTRQRQGIPVQPWKFFKYVKKIFFDQEHGFLLLAYRESQCIAGAIFLHSNKVLTYKYGASRSDSLKYRPNNLVMWAAIQWAYDHGFTRFDLGRTDLENIGLRLFKSRWGALETPLFYTGLGANSMHRGKGELMSYMNTILKKSPAWVCRLSGEILYKYFG